MSCIRNCWVTKPFCILVVLVMIWLHTFVKTQKYILNRMNINICTAAAKSLQSCDWSGVYQSCDLGDGSPPGSPVPGILQVRTLERVAISFSNAWKWKVNVKLLSCVRLLVTPWTAAYQAPPPLGFSRQE